LERLEKPKPLSLGDMLEKQETAALDNKLPQGIVLLLPCALEKRRCEEQLAKEGIKRIIGVPTRAWPLQAH